MPKSPAFWVPSLGQHAGPVYLAIADAIAADIAKGRLKPGARLPPQRTLAGALGIDFTTVTRAYAEARQRGLVEGRVGHGTYVRPSAERPARLADLGMNLPPHIRDPKLDERLRAGIDAVAAEGQDLFLAYQDPAGAEADRQAAGRWLAPRLPGLAPERIVVCPGTQGAMVAALNLLARPGDTVCTEALTYPGFLALAAHLGLRIVPVAMDADGLDPDSFAAVCETARPKMLYCTPTFHNPTTATLPPARRARIVEIARRHGVAILEDDVYGALPEAPVPPLAALAPDIVYYMAGLAKCLSPALRIAYLVPPDARAAMRAAGAVRAFSGMASPVTAAIATRWIEDGTADTLLRALRAETMARQQIAARLLPQAKTHPCCFHAWLVLPKGWTAGALTGRARLAGIGLVTADAFAVGSAPEAARIALGVARDREALARGLDILAGLLAQPPGTSTNVV